MNIFMPTIYGNSVFPCNMEYNEYELFKLIKNHPEQKRKTLTCNEILCQVARNKAIDMVENGYVGHVDPDGYGMNFYVRQAGYELPGMYEKHDTANNIESLGVSYYTPESVFLGLMNSPMHKQHIMGLISFFEDQINIGIGCYRNRNVPHRHKIAWVILTAP